MTFSKSYKAHLLVGLGVGVWLVLFLVLIAPFDVSDLTFLIRIKITVVYGLIFFLSYLACIIVQNALFKKFSKWSIKLEIILYALMYLVGLPFIIIYYKSGIVNGDYSISAFILEQYIPILIIITPIMFLLRRFVSKKGKVISVEEGMITLKGENKNDILRLKSDTIISVNSSDNYVEVSYLEQNTLKKKLLRTTLSKVESEFEFLTRSHRSYLINTDHFIEWTGKDTAKLTQAEVPVSKQYKEAISSIVRP